MPHCDNVKCKTKDLEYKIFEKSAGGDNCFYIGVYCEECDYTHRISAMMDRKEALVQLEIFRAHA